MSESPIAPATSKAPTRNSRGEAAKNKVQNQSDIERQQRRQNGEENVGREEERVRRIGQERLSPMCQRIPQRQLVTVQRGHHLDSLGIEKLIEISEKERAVGQRAAEEEEDGDREKPGMRLTDDAAHHAFSKAPMRRNFL